MARLSVSHPEVISVIDALLPVVADAGSVNATVERLNRALAAMNVRTPVYANRVHTLLSDDPSRSLNQATIDLIRKAIDALPEGQPYSFEADPSKQLAEEALRRWRQSSRSPSAVREIADGMTVPPALVRHLLERAGELPKAAPLSAAVDSKDVITTEVHRDRKRVRPDWTFQDTAVHRCVNALNVSADRKVGLIVPTGAGKTRIALRVALARLVAQSNSTGKVIWVTHRRNLRTQAHRELQRMLSEGIPDLPANSAELLAKRIEFIMVSDLAKVLGDASALPLLLIIDEAHHAAAVSYQPIFESGYPLRALFLTATPNRTDKLPIGIDEIAYTITYRELSDRGVILLPDFEDFSVADFDWSEPNIRELADEIISRAADDYVKVLVLAPRINRVEEFYQALQDRLGQESNHPLSEEDIGFVHSAGNSFRVLDSEGNLVSASADEFLDHFSKKPRAIIVSAQLLLEGFNDPEINTVVITYPSSSMIVLMQAAGRCVRYTPTKRKAIVLQARNDLLAYHFDQRWLYQEISDDLRPQLVDLDYSDLNDLRAKIGNLLQQHNTPAAIQNTVFSRLETIAPGDRCRLFLSGIPYYGDRDTFSKRAQWSALLETSSNSAAFRDLFNVFSGMGAGLSDPTDFLRNRGASFGISQNLSEGSEWRLYMDMLIAMYFAHLEVYEDGSTTPHGMGRPFVTHGATTWLKYVTLHYRPVVPDMLAKFVADCHNRETILAAYQANAANYARAVKLPLPLGGAEGFLFTSTEAQAFDSLVEKTRNALASVPPLEQIARLASHVAQLPSLPLPLSIVNRIERYLMPAEAEARLLDLTALSLPVIPESKHETSHQPAEDPQHA